MQSYFVNETPGYEKRLRGAQIPFEPFMCGEQKGIVFDETHLPLVLTTLRSTVERQDKSGYDGIQVLHLKQNGMTSAAPLAPATVTVEKWGNYSDEAQCKNIKRVVGEFSTNFAVREIVLFDNDRGHDPRVPRSDEGKLFINFWCSPRGTYQRGDSATHLWSYKISDSRGLWNIWRPSGEGQVIKDDAGAEVAEVVGNNIYVLYPITDRRVASCDEILRKILEAAALLLGGSPQEIAKRRREAEKRRKAEFEAEVKANPVIVKKWWGSDSLRDKFVAVAKDFVQALGGKQIRIYDYSSDKEKHPPVADGRVDICVWSSSDNVESGGKMQPLLFGAPLKWNYERCVIAPSGETGDLVTDEDGNQFGKVMGDTIYLHYALASRDANLVWDGKGPEALFRRMLEEVVFLKTATAKQKAARARAIALKHRAKSLEEYTKVCNGRFEKTVEQSRSIVSNNPDKVRQYQQAIVKLVRESNDAEKKLQYMENSRAEAITAYAQEFDKLLEVPKILDVRVSDGVIKVFTDTLYCIDSRTGKRHEIGAFRIEINPELEVPVRWHNLTRKVDGYSRGMNAPHVHPDGKACLGNMAEVIPQLVADYEFAALAMVCIQFVESANVDDSAGKHINKWPLAA